MDQTDKAGAEQAGKRINLRCRYCRGLDLEKYPSLARTSEGWTDDQLAHGYQMMGDGKNYHCYAAYMEG